MEKVFDIIKRGKVLIIILSALFLLSACSSNSTNAALSQSDVESSTQISCWEQEVFTPIYDVIGTTVMKMYNTLSEGVMSVMMTAFAIWLALRLMKFVSSVAEDSPGEIWNEILKKAFVCLFCGLLASSSSMLLYTINSFLFPIYGAFLEFGSEILKKANDTTTSITVLGQEIQFAQNTACALPKNAEATLTGFPDGFKTMMGCMLCAIDERLILGRKIALLTMTYGGIMAFFIGLLIWLIFFIVGLGFVFYFVDSIFRFGMMILLLPILIMSYAFGPTRKWTGIGFSNIMNSAAFMMAFSIIIATTLMAMTEVVNSHKDIFSPSDDMYASTRLLRDFSVTMLCLLLLSFLIYGSLEVSQQLTSAIVGGKTTSNFQQNLKAVLQTAVGIVTSGIGSVIRKSGFMEKTRIGRMLTRGNAVKGRLNQLAGREK